LYEKWDLDNYSIESDEVKKNFFDKLSKWKIVTREKKDHLGNSEIHYKEVTPYIIEPMEDELEDHEILLCVRLEASWNDDNESADTTVNIIDQAYEPICQFTRKYRDLIGFTLLGSKRNPLYELSMNRRSLLSRKLDDDEILKGLRTLILELDNIKKPLLEQSSVQELLLYLNEVADPESIGLLEGFINSKFTFTFLNGELWRLRGATSLATTLKLMSGEEIALPLDNQGNGFQNLILLFHIIGLLRESRKNVIIAVEEPEQNLEPALARCIFGEICSLTADAEEKHCGQVFVTTHSPSLVGEFKGAESLLIFSNNINTDIERHQNSPGYLSGRFFSPDVRKKLDQNREQYINCLFSRQVLIVEGASEIGFLPVAFRYFSKLNLKKNPYHLGLEVMNGSSCTESVMHAKILKSYGRICHVLLDYDGPNEELEKNISSRFDGAIDYVSSWPKQDLLGFTRGCDLEVILAATIDPETLFFALKMVYEDAGHPLEEKNWESACSKINDSSVVSKFPKVFGEFNIETFDLQDLGEEYIQRAFLFALLHGPHCCKSTKDMRIIAEYLAENNKIPIAFEVLQDRVLNLLKNTKEMEHDQPYLSF